MSMGLSWWLELADRNADKAICTLQQLSIACIKDFVQHSRLRSHSFVISDYLCRQLAVT